MYDNGLGWHGIFFFASAFDFLLSTEASDTAIIKNNKYTFSISTEGDALARTSWRLECVSQGHTIERYDIDARACRPTAAFSTLSHPCVKQ